MRVSAAHTAWERWQASAGPWKGWSVCPTLLAPAVEEVTVRRVRRPNARELATSLASSMQPGGSLVLLDLEPILGVHIAALLNEWRVANGVLVLPRWPYQIATLPVDGLLFALVGQAKRLAPPEDMPNVAFVLDADRSRSIGRRAAGDRRADNRYRLAVADLPNLASLKARGIRQVVQLSPAPTP